MEAQTTVRLFLSSVLAHSEPFSIMCCIIVESIRIIAVSLFVHDLTVIGDG